MKNEKLKRFELRKKIEGLVAEANFSLRADVLKLLKKAYLSEKSSKAKKALGWILDNADIARKEKLAICQDTGLAIVFVEAGRKEVVCSSTIKVIQEAIACGYRKNYLRPSVVAPLKRGTPSYKGAIVHLHFSSKIKGIKITVFPKGFGSENKSQLKMFNPTATIKEIEDFIVDSIIAAGAGSCPPFIVGVGIGGSSDY
ncbi:MAG: fumarate hydratase, partial [Candidatus Omnitrophota bacterium]